MNTVEFARKICEMQDDVDHYYEFVNSIKYCAVRKWELYNEGISESFLLKLAGIVIPRNTGYRQTPVYFEKTGRTAVSWQLIPRQIEIMLQFQKIILPLEFYRNFEIIHPFEDGNGRVGTLLYNILNRSLNDLQIPPEIEF